MNVRKNIVICSDGTGNTTIKGRGTNVFKLYEAIDQNGHRSDPGLIPQVAIYHDGVGTESIKWLRIFAGATGYGLSRHVKDLYQELARVYRPGDRIYLFGFSRGAFTVRTLAGLINMCGILDLAKFNTNEKLRRAANQAYGEYRRKYASWLTALYRRRTTFGPAEILELRRRFSVYIPEFRRPAAGDAPRVIRFLGVWDTVDAVGLPFRIAQVWNTIIYAFKFPDRTLKEQIGHACHALALDEERESFEPVLWNEKETSEPERLEQVWFAGVHSNVGGGYPRHGLSLISLDWMMTRAEAHGLRFIESERCSYQAHADVGDKLYDSRAGAAVLYRWKPRNVEAICRRNGIDPPKVHCSVYERIALASEGYAPGSVPPDAEVVSTTASPWLKNDVRDLVRAGHRGGSSLLQRNMRLHQSGSWAYWLLMLSLLATLVLVCWDHRSSLFRDRLVFGTHWPGWLVQTWWNHPWLVVSIAATLTWGLHVERMLDRRYSEFWQGLRLDLRDALGLGGKRDRADQVAVGVGAATLRP